jgi:hypothetical protein
MSDEGERLQSPCLSVQRSRTPARASACRHEQSAALYSPRVVMAAIGERHGSCMGTTAQRCLSEGHRAIVTSFAPVDRGPRPS